MKKLFQMFSFLLMFFLSSVQFISADVNIENGNFFYTLTLLDVLGPGDRLVMEVTWNSRSVNLMFSEPWTGKGFGSEYETYLVPLPDNSAVIYEIGSGAQTVFEAKDGMENVKSVEKIIAAVYKSNGKSDKEISDILKNGLDKVEDVGMKTVITSLKENAERRRIYAQKYGVKSVYPVGTKFVSYTMGYQELVRTEVGYERIYNDGRVETFSLNGELIQIRDKNGYKIDLSYNEEKFPDGRRKCKSVLDSVGKGIDFKWYPNGKLQMATSNKGGSAEFFYNDVGDLIKVKDARGEFITFGYKDHLLELITFQDKTTVKIQYDSKTKFVIDVKERDDVSTGYKYSSNPADPNKDYSTEVTKKGFNGEPFINKFHWIRKIRADGVQFLFRTENEVGGVLTKTEFHEKCGTPLKIERFGKLTSFSYDEACLLKKKDAANGDKFELDYDPTWRKISRIKHKDGWIQYEYDQKGNLKTIKDDKGVRITLFYNFKGQIFNMIYSGKDSSGKAEEKNISFEYNANGKPEYIELKSVGRAHLIYDPNTLEFKDVEPKLDKNPKLFDGVTTAFNVLLDIVRYKGVDLNY